MYIIFFHYSELKLDIIYKIIDFSKIVGYICVKVLETFIFKHFLTTSPPTSKTRPRMFYK